MINLLLCFVDMDFLKNFLNNQNEVLKNDNNA
jgi:hypothetical protein